MLEFFVANNCSNLHRGAVELVEPTETSATFILVSFYFVAKLLRVSKCYYVYYILVYMNNGNYIYENILDLRTQLCLFKIFLRLDL